VRNHIEFGFTRFKQGPQAQSTFAFIWKILEPLGCSDFRSTSPRNERSPIRSTHYSPVLSLLMRIFSPSQVRSLPASDRLQKSWPDQSSGQLMTSAPSGRPDRPFPGLFSATQPHKGNRTSELGKRHFKSITFLGLRLFVLCQSPFLGDASQHVIGESFGGAKREQQPTARRDPDGHPARRVAAPRKTTTSSHAPFFCFHAAGLVLIEAKKFVGSYFFLNCRPAFVLFTFRCQAALTFLGLTSASELI